MQLRAQFNDTAIYEIDMVCSGGNTTRSGVAFDPNNELYFSVNAGTPTAPVETFASDGSDLASAIPYFDYRGVWWNPNSNQLEGNGYNSAGIVVQNVNASGYAIDTAFIQYSSNGQPNNQSNGEYDYDADEVIYYYNNSIYRYLRSNGTLISSSTISGLPAGAALNPNSVGYTGVTGMEYCVYDYANQAVHYINKATTAYVASTYLPGDAIAVNNWGQSFANNRLFLYNSGTSTWKSYVLVFNCSDTDSTITESACDSFTWIDGNTYTESTDTTYIIANSQGCDSVISLSLTITETPDATITATDSLMELPSGFDSYQWYNEAGSILNATGNSYIAPESGNYYCTMSNGMCTSNSDTVEIIISIDTVNTSILEFNTLDLSVFPNPAKDIINIDTELEDVTSICLYNLSGAKVQQYSGEQRELHVDAIAKGIYILEVKTINKIHVAKVIIE